MRFNYKLVALLMATVAGALFILGKGDVFGLSTLTQRLLAVAALIIVFLGIVLLYVTLVRSLDRNAANREVGSAEVVGTPPEEELQDRPHPIDDLQAYLHAESGMRWRYRRSWLLLSGEESVIARALPDLVDTGWLVTQDAVLLWNKTGVEGRPDPDWLRQIYKLRRRRPIDAVVLTLDGDADLSLQRRGVNAHSVNLACIADVLYWSAPVYVLDVAKTDAFNNGRTALLGCEFATDANERSIESTLLELRSRIGHMSIGQLIRSYKDQYSAQLSQRLDTRSAPLAAMIASLANRRARHQSVSAAFFAPFPVATDATHQAADPNALDGADLPIWNHLAKIARKQRGTRMGWHPVTVFSTIALSVIGIWTAGMLISGMTNGLSLSEARQTIQTLKTAPDPAARLQALLALQQQIGRYEDRVAHQPPVWSRFGLNQDKAILAALWPPYTEASKLALITPIQRNLEAELVDLSQMPTESLDDQTNAAALEGHKALKTYLMLADPSRVDAAFITPQLVRYWSTNANVSVGAKLDISERLADFYAQHLKAHDTWRIQPRADLVNASRQTLLSVIVVRNSEDTVYQSVLAGVGNKYPDQTLASLTAGTDTRGLIRTSVTVPGVYTRQAYEGYVAAAITEAAKNRDVTRDWVLANNDSSANAAAVAQASSTDALKLALTTQYFNDYAEHWQEFMNALQWQPAPNIPAAIEQMKLLADARQSPVIALMKSLDYQGTAGIRQSSLSNTLITAAQNILGKKEDPQATVANDAGPLSASFGPVLRMIGQVSDTEPAKGNAPPSDVSLQRYLERVTALRLKLQQISNGTDADAQTRQLAQALFQGKGSELADTQAYGQLIAASLGAEWSGMGDALFVRPVAQATQIVLQPAQASLNDTWGQSIVAAWNKSFAGRYPFDNTDNDASIPELARFIRPQGGLVPTFLSTQLAGVLELQGDQWVEVNSRGGALQFNPAFLKAVNMLQRVAGHLMAQGEPQYRFDLKPVPTPGITDTLLTIDTQKLHYYNQRERWQALTWPSNDTQSIGTRLQWQTEQAGTSKNFEFAGRWALVRMLERAKVEPIDSATFQLTWQAQPDTRMVRVAAVPSSASERPSLRTADDWSDSARDDSGSSEHAALDSLVTQQPLTPPSANLTYPLSYLMRTDVGKGPLELLALKGFTLPTRMFIDKPRAANPSTANPPPLPKAARDAAKHAATPLPDVTADLMR
jgi:type VI secretion system protein ImpL